MLDRRLQILAGWLASARAKDSEIERQLVAAVPATGHAQWQDFLEQINAPRLKRLMNRNGSGAVPLDPSQMQFADQQVLWQGRQIGRTRLFYKAPLPHETQARIAYEIFFDRFNQFIASRYHAVVLSQSAFHLELFLPAVAPDLAALWSDFVAHAFSAGALKRSFADLVSSIKLSERGFSALRVPILSQDQALYLAAFYLANLNSLKKGDDRRRQDIATEEKKLAEAKNEKEVQRIEKNIAKLQQELDTRLQRYRPFYEMVDQYRTKHPAAMTAVDRVARTDFTGIAGIQINKAAGKIGKCIRDIERLLTITDADLGALPPLISANPLTAEARAGGDSSNKSCYGCGRLLKSGDWGETANKFIFESPSQRLQSAAGQREPKICGACAAISFVSPIKMGSGRLVVRMRPQGDSERYLAEDQLRMFIMGELGIIAGKYAILRATEQVGEKLVADQLGGEQYALYKTAISFPPLVFQQYQVEALINNVEVPLPGRQLAVMHRLSRIFYLEKPKWNDKGQFVAFGRAVRHVQQDELAFAVYELITSGLVTGDLPPDRARQLEELRAEHVRLTMNENPTLAQQYKDIAAMTGLLYPFCVAVNNALRSDPPKQRIEVRKVIERVDDPHELLYTVAPYISGERKDGQYDFSAIRVFLNRSPDTYFSFAQLQTLLKELSYPPDERRGESDARLPITLDDVNNVFTYLYETRYASDKARREFSYKLKLSLAARFPKHYEKKESEKE